MTTHNFFKQLNLFQLIAENESFLATVFFLLFLTLICQATESRIKLQWVVCKFRILYIFSFFNSLENSWKMTPESGSPGDPLVTVSGMY